MDRRKRICIWLAVCVILVSLGMSPNVFAVTTDSQETAEKVVKVAYILSPGYQEGGEGEYKCGQGYEYLQKIASYTGWTYEYVYGNFGELLQKLADGEIDLMGNLSYTEDRAGLVSYGNYEQGRETFYVYVNGDDSGIAAEDFATINGKKIGVSAGSYQEIAWKSWCEDHDIQCELVEFSSMEERQRALNDGEIDASLESLIQNREEETKNWRSVFSFGDAPYYFAVNKKKPELLKELNKAQGKILNDDPYYNEDLNKRYMPNGILSRTQLDSEERAWLEQHKDPLKIGCMKGYLPISDVDEEGKIRGVLPDVIAAIQEKFQEYGSVYDLVGYEDYEQMITDLKNGVIDAAAPVYGDYWNADQEGISLTNPFMTTTMLLLQQKNLSEDEIKRIGIDKQSTIQKNYATIYYSDYEQVLYPSMEEVTKALKKGEIDAALSTACCYHVKAVLNTDLGKLNRSTLPNDVNIAMAVSKNNIELMSLVNRGLSSIGDKVVYNSLASNSNVEKKVTLQDYVSANPGATIVIVITILAFAVLIIAALIVVVIRLKNANARASTDAMTGLLNKVSMRELAKEELKHGGVLFMLDIDNFKRINDELGHEMGDKVINHLAESLQKIFRSGDLISRFGGDEFLILLPGSAISEELIADKVKQIQDALASFEDFSEKNWDAGCSVSAGVLIFEANSNLTYTDAFQKVDDALYAAKNNGKKTFVITKC